MQALDRNREMEAALGPLFGYAQALTGDLALSEDLVQETALRAIAARKVPDQPRAFRSWLFTILRNAFIDHLRRQGRHSQLDECNGERAAAQAPDAWRDAEALVNDLTVKLAVRQLRVAEREIIGLIDIAGFSYAEAAGILKVPIGTVMSRISRARAALIAAVAESNVLPLKAKRRAES
ncbi:MAG: RNA polymerase sigma factor [Kiloniellales bacterium]